MLVIYGENFPYKYDTHFSIQKERMSAPQRSMQLSSRGLILISHDVYQYYVSNRDTEGNEDSKQAHRINKADSMPTEICSPTIKIAKDANFDGGSKIKYEPENLTEGQHAAIDETADRKTKNNEKEEEEAKDREGISQMEESTILTGDLEETNESLLLQSPQAQVNFHEDDHNLNPETPTKYLKKTLKSSSTEFSPPEEVKQKKSRRTHTILFERSVTLAQAEEPILTEDQQRDLIRTAQFVFNEFIRVGAPQQVNIQGRTREKIVQEMKNARIDTQLFVDAETEAIKLLQRDKFPDFRASSSFENLINLVCNGTYVVDERTMKGAKKIRRKSLDRTKSNHSIGA